MVSVPSRPQIGVVLAVLFVSVGLSGCTSADEKPSDNRPNVLLVMADDMGYSDLGSFGAVHVNTPHLDRMAQQGMRFTQFYNMAKCNPTRATLLSGLYTEKKHLSRAQALPDLLNRSGYYTAIAGKEHFSGWYPDHLYADNVFDDSFVYWAINPYFRPGDGTFPNPFRLNGKSLDPDELVTSRDRLYKTDVVTNYGLRFLDNAAQSDSPFFLYMPYHVPHYPLQARAEDIEKYEEAFREGWDQLRRDRFARQKELGVIPSNAELSEPESNIYPHDGPDEWARYDPWSSVPEGKRDDYAREMAAYAAMIDRLDQNVGRIMDKLRAMGEAENTLVLFLSDNGACPFDNGGYTGHGDPPFGAPGSYGYQRPEWAAAANTPFRYFKQYGHEGGAHTPFFAYWPGEIESGTITDQVGHVADLMPTLLDVTDTAYPDTTIGGHSTPALDGTSLVPTFRGQEREADRLVISGFGSDKRMVRFGDWKIVRVKNRPWELYNLAEDPTETNDLADERTEKVRALEKRFTSWKKQHGASF